MACVSAQFEVGTGKAFFLKKNEKIKRKGVCSNEEAKIVLIK